MAAVDYFELTAPVWSGRFWRDRLRCQRRVQQVANHPDSISDAKANLRYALMRRAARSLVLVPSDSARLEIAAEVESRLGFKTFDATAIEDSKRPFISEKQAVAIVANRYDEGRCSMSAVLRSAARIRELNDAFRRTLCGGRRP